MNRNRKVQAAAITLSAGIMLAGAAVPAEAAPVAGASAMVQLASADTAAGTEDTSSVTGTGSTLSGVNRALADVVSDTSDELDAEEDAAAEKAADEQAKYDKLAVGNVSDYANVRKKASQNSDLVGQIYNNNLATVLDTKGDWIKIESGKVTGWVKKDYLTVGSEDAVKKAAKKIATVNTTTLKVREKPDQNSEVLDLVPGTTKLKVVSTKDQDKGWIKVKADDDTGYVSTEYVTVKDTYSRAKTIEAVKAEEAAKAEQDAAATTSTTAATSTTTTTTTTQTSSSRSASSSSSGSKSSGSSKSYSAPSGGSGSSVASYACQFVGNPYVWGGTSLTNGADCSGFVMSVYRKFGVSLPHSSSADRGVGRSVSKSNMQAGDIVCYSGHVAIYIGGGRIVHASNARDGIKISNANYRNIAAVRRVL